MLIDYKLLQSSYAYRHNFYQSSQWILTREWVKSNEPLCRICKSKGILTPGEEIDHITDIKKVPELCLDLKNLQHLCKKCHSEKTARENGFGKKFESVPYKSTEFKF